MEVMAIGVCCQRHSTVGTLKWRRQWMPTLTRPKAFGQEVIMVSYAQGEVVATPGYDVIKQLDSFVYLETGISVGSKVEHTVDLVMSVGSVILLNTDKEVLKQDVEKIRDMEKKNELFMLT
jgi:hypothetical protein